MTTDVGRFRSLLAGRMGWTFADSDVPHLMRVLDRRADDSGLARAAYLARFESLDGQGWEDETTSLTEHLTITETYFFRHGEQFRALTDVLPKRIAARAQQRTLRLLSVGCSSGEEAYTLAVVARQAQPDPSWVISVLGVDANPAVLRRAAAAHYSAWSLRETPDAVRSTYFHKHDGSYEVAGEIRRLVRWQRHNVADDDPQLFQSGRYDVIFCRNLLMYLAPETHAALIRRMTGALAPGGYLFLGHTDSLGSRPEGLETQHTHSTFYYRRPEVPGIAAPTSRLSVPDVHVPEIPVVPPPVAGGDQERTLRLIHEERFAEALAAIDGSGPRDGLMRGVVLAQSGRVPDAEAEARRLVDADGLDADAHHLLAMCTEATAGPEAAQQYRLAAYLDPAFAMPRLRLGLLTRRRGDHRAAAAELDRAMHLLRDERDERIVLFGGGFSRIALTQLCRAELDACGARR